MTDRGEGRPSLIQWMRSPEVLVGLSALLLGVCGLGVSLYEAHLMRRAQRASVWPFVDVSASVTAEQVSIWVQNTGVGPARIRSARVSVGGAPLARWTDVLDSVLTARHAPVAYYQSLINGRVLPASSSRERIFSVEAGDDSAARTAVDVLGRAILEWPVAEALDVTLCYCSVYEDCWESELQDVLGRASRDDQPPGAEHPVERCDVADRSAI